MSSITNSVIDRCKKDPEYKQEILDFLERIEGAIEEIRNRLGE